MSDLRTLHRTLVGAAAVTTPPYEAVVGRARRRQRHRSTAGFFASITLAMLASTTGVLDDAAEQRTRVGDIGTSTSSPATTTAGGGEPNPPPAARTAQATRGTEAGATGTPTTSQARANTCRAEANGGATGTGVTGDRIRLIAGALLDGPAKGAVEDVPAAWKAAFDAVNEAGGICGRRVEVRVANRLFAGPPDLGQEDYVGMLAGPLDADFDVRLRDGSIDRWGIPVVGGDGGDRAQFTSSWMWAVDVPGASFARIAVDEAYQEGARSIAVVHDAAQPFGVQVARAVEQYVATLPGATVRGITGLDPAQPSYTTEANELRSRCTGGCDAVILALLPETAKKWLQVDGPRGTRRAAAPAWLLSDRFGQDCVLLVGTCDNFRIWTGFTPPFSPFDEEPDVSRYIADVGQPNAMNPWTRSGYVAAQVMVAALRHAGPHLTRRSLQEALDALTYRSGLVSPLDWGPRLPSERVANAYSRAVRIKSSSGTFRGFQDAGTGWMRDPWPGRFPD